MKFLLKIFSPSILMISLLFLTYTFYKSEIYYDGGQRNYYNSYYYILLTLIFFSVITFFINRNIKEYLIIISISLVISLYLFEAYLIVKKQSSLDRQSSQKKSPQQLLESINQNTKEQLYKKRTGKKWDRRTRLKIYEDLKKINNEIVVNVPPSIHYKNKNHIFFPLSGISNSPTIYCNENGYYSMYQSDRYGFNNPDDEWDKKEIEYFLVGDSSVNGACVNRPNDISSILRTLSSKTVLNISYSGNGPLIQYAALREYFKPNIKKVLWFYYEGSDLRDLISEKKNIVLINYLNDLNFTQNLKFRQNEVDDFIVNIIEDKVIKQKQQLKIILEEEKETKSIKVKLIKFLKIENIRILTLPLPNYESPIDYDDPLTPPEFKKILHLTKDLVEKNNSKLYFIYMPQYQRYINKKYDNTNYNFVKNIVNELNIPFIDLHKKVFEKEKNPFKYFPFEMPGHYNIEGYKKITETIFYSMNKEDKN